MLTLAETRVDRYILRDFRDEIDASSNCSACAPTTTSVIHLLTIKLYFYKRISTSVMTFLFFFFSSNVVSLKFITACVLQRKNETIQIQKNVYFLTMFTQSVRTLIIYTTHMVKHCIRICSLFSVQIIKREIYFFLIIIFMLKVCCYFEIFSYFVYCINKRSYLLRDAHGVRR